jgi:hypothetical protein
MVAVLTTVLIITLRLFAAVAATQKTDPMTPIKQFSSKRSDRGHVGLSVLESTQEGAMLQAIPYTCEKRFREKKSGESSE